MSDILLSHTDKHGVCTVTLNRPEKHNAFDSDTIDALITRLKIIESSDEVRILVLTGTGKSFSSGADLDWMKNMATMDQLANQQDALRLATLMSLLYRLGKPTIARINGPAYGGALGLIACCDLAFSVDNAIFAFTEVRLGLIPAVISPYIVNAIGPRQSNRLFLTGESFSAIIAQEMGLIHATVKSTELDKVIETHSNYLLRGGPQALKESKRLVHHLASIHNDVTVYTADLIAKIRVSKEGQSGLTAFLNKSRPPWND